MRPRLRFVALLCLLVALLVWAWVTDRPSPAAPHGEFLGVVLSGFVLVGLALLVILPLRPLSRLKRKPLK
jgi:hypothetical protein